jgi:hypothetical protein
LERKAETDSAAGKIQLLTTNSNTDELT